MKQKHIIVALTVALLLSLFFRPSCNPPPPEPVVKKEIKEVVKTIAADSTKFIKQVAAAEAKAMLLKAELTSTITDLNTAQELVVELLNDAPVVIGMDSAEVIAKLEYLKAENDRKDSLCNSAIVTQDSIISAMTERHQATLEFNSKIRASVNDLTGIAKDREAETKYWKKRYKKAKAGQTIFKIVAIAAAAVAVNQSL